MPETGYALPPGYSMFNGTSMASPQATGAAALLLSAAKATGKDAPAPGSAHGADQHRGPDRRRAHHRPGHGTRRHRGRVEAARSKGARHGRTTWPHRCARPLSHQLATPDPGTGVYNRCLPDDGGQRPGTTKTYSVSVTRLDGSSGATRAPALVDRQRRHRSRPPRRSRCAGVRPRTIRITARPRSAGAHSAILRVDDPATKGIDQLVPVTVVATDVAGAARSNRQRSAAPSSAPTPSRCSSRCPRASRTWSSRSPASRAATRSGSSRSTRTACPWTIQASNRCYTNHSDPAATAATPAARSYEEPAAGIWEFQVEARRTSPVAGQPVPADRQAPGRRR